MTPEDESIAAECLRLASEEDRRAYLQRACAGNEALRARVEQKIEQATLRVDRNAGRAGEIQAMLTAGLTERPGERIGRYKLLEQIGEGGFGAVWMAEQSEPVTRQVALKITKLGMDTREVIARFDAERQVLAMMNHPNISTVLDVGSTESGRPFFVMELVKGIPITEFCDTHQLDIRRRLELFIDVCSAVQHAHQKGVIHRDLKPSNVLAAWQGDKPLAKVIDFGIAKATQQKLTEMTLFTSGGQIWGTPIYMSPEQTGIGGVDIDTRSDVYSLGVLLYELLASVPPFDPHTLISSGLDEMRRVIFEEDPPRPSVMIEQFDQDGRRKFETTRQLTAEKLTREFRGELDWIVMRAIEKDRTRRYETANALILDLRRYLNNDDVLARPPTAAYKFGKFARRNRGALAAAGAIFLVLIAATVVSMWHAHEARKARDLAEDLYGKMRAGQEAVLTAQANAETEQKRAETTLEFLIESFRPGEQEAAILRRAEAELREQFEDDPLMRMRLLEAIAKTHSALGRPDHALRLRREAAKLAKENIPTDDQRAWERRLALAAELEGEGTLDGGRLREAEQIMRALVADVERSLSSDDSFVLACKQRLLSVLLRRLGSPPDSERLKEAESLGTQTYEAALQKYSPDHGFINGMRNLLADVRGRQGDHEREENLLMENWNFVSRAGRDRGHGYVNQALQLGWFYDDRRNFEAAEKFKRAAIEVGRDALGEAHPLMFKARRELGWLLVDRGRGAEAEAFFQESVSVCRGRADQRIHLAGNLKDLGHYYNSQGPAKLDREIEAFDESLQLYSELSMRDQKAGIDLMALLSDAHRRHGERLSGSERTPEMEANLKRAEELAQQHYALSKEVAERDPGSPEPTRFELAKLRRVRGDFREAEAMLVEAERLARQRGDDRELWKILKELVIVGIARGDYRAAATSQRQLYELTPNSTTGKKLVQLEALVGEFSSQADVFEQQSDGVDLDSSGHNILGELAEIVLVMPPKEGHPKRLVDRAIAMADRAAQLNEWNVWGAGFADLERDAVEGAAKKFTKNAGNRAPAIRIQCLAGEAIVMHRMGDRNGAAERLRKCETEFRKLRVWNEGHVAAEWPILELIPFSDLMIQRARRELLDMR